MNDENQKTVNAVTQELDEALDSIGGTTNYEVMHCDGDEITIKFQVNRVPEDDYVGLTYY